MPKNADSFRVLNSVRASAPNPPTERERILSEMAFERKRGNWKRANDLRRHYGKLIKEGRE